MGRGKSGKKGGWGCGLRGKQKQKTSEDKEEGKGGGGSLLRQAVGCNLARTAKQNKKWSAAAAVASALHGSAVTEGVCFFAFFA